MLYTFNLLFLFCITGKLDKVEDHGSCSPSDNRMIDYKARRDQCMQNLCDDLKITPQSGQPYSYVVQWGRIPAQCKSLDSWNGNRKHAKSGMNTF